MMERDRRRDVAKLGKKVAARLGQLQCLGLVRLGKKDL
jgi:hypothetical protein